MQQPLSALTDFESSVLRYFADRRKSASGQSAGADHNGWREFAHLGWLGAAFPEELGGYGGWPEMSVLAHAVGHALATEPFVEAIATTTSFLARAATTAQQREVLQRAMVGETVICTVLGSYDESPTGNLSFDRTPNGINLSGAATHVIGANAAEHLLMTATDADGRRTVLLVECSLPGIRKETVSTVDGRRASFFTFEGVTLPASSEFSDAGKALQAFDLAADAGLIAQSADLVGVMDRAFELSRDYLSARRQFGQSLASFQALRHRLADMYAELEQARAMLSAGVAALSYRSPAARARISSGCKVRAIKAAQFVCAQAIQLHGAIGLTEQYDVGRCYKRFLVIANTWGDLEFHLRRFVANDDSDTRDGTAS